MKKSKKSDRDKLYKKYVAHMSNKHRKERFKIFLDGVALSLPLLAAFSWYVSLIFRSISPIGDIQLSPLKTEPIIVFVLVFIVAYCIFLMFEYNLLRKRLVKVQKSK